MGFTCLQDSCWQWPQSLMKVSIEMRWVVIGIEMWRFQIKSLNGKECVAKNCECIDCVSPLVEHMLVLYLVDPASSHMLVSKIKPCMFQYKL